MTTTVVVKCELLSVLLELTSEVNVEVPLIVIVSVDLGGVTVTVDSDLDTDEDEDPLVVSVSVDFDNVTVVVDATLEVVCELARLSCELFWVSEDAVLKGTVMVFVGDSPDLLDSEAVMGEPEVLPAFESKELLD